MNDIQIPVTTKRKRTRVASRVGNGTVSTTVCIKKDSVVKRLSRPEADKLVAVEGWSYAPRSVWKKEVRDVKGYVAPVVEQVEVKKKAKKVKTDKPRKANENKA
jgi:hypothetical protein